MSTSVYDPRPRKRTQFKDIVVRKQKPRTNRTNRYKANKYRGNYKKNYKLPIRGKKQLNRSQKSFKQGKEKSTVDDFSQQKEKEKREQEKREQERREQQRREQEKREQKRREQEIRETKRREQELREKQRREQEIREQKRREQEKQEERREQERQQRREQERRKELRREQEKRAEERREKEKSSTKNGRSFEPTIAGFTDLDKASFKITKKLKKYIELYSRVLFFH